MFGRNDDFHLTVYGLKLLDRLMSRCKKHKVKKLNDGLE